MESGPLNDYIRTCRKDGIRDHDIAGALLAAGWNAQQVVDAFNAVTGVTAKPVTPSKQPSQHPDFMIYFGVLLVLLVIGTVVAYLLATHHLF